jgi:hypothetical protein
MQSCLTEFGFNELVVIRQCRRNLVLQIEESRKTIQNAQELLKRLDALLGERLDDLLAPAGKPPPVTLVDRGIEHSAMALPRD